MAGAAVSLRGDPRASMLLRVRQPSPRVLELLHGIPGVELFAPVSARAAVQVGYRHPIQLSSVTRCFPGEDMYLFRGAVGRVERLDGAPKFIEGRQLVDGGVQMRQSAAQNVELRKLEPMRVELRIRPSARVREPRGALIAWEQVDLLRRLVYLVPTVVLEASRMVTLEEGRNERGPEVHS